MFDIFLTFAQIYIAQNIDCDYTLGPPRRGYIKLGVRGGGKNVHVLHVHVHSYD